MDNNTFIPTHLIRWTPRGGAMQLIPVALIEGGSDLGMADHLPSGPAYTREEWLTESVADWERQADGSWTCLGQATPGGAIGTVEVLPVTSLMLALMDLLAKPKQIDPFGVRDDASSSNACDFDLWGTKVSLTSAEETEVLRVLLERFAARA